MFIPKNINKANIYNRRDKLLRWLRNRNIDFSYLDDHITIIIPPKDKVIFDVYSMKFSCTCGFKRKGRASLDNHIKKHHELIILKELQPKTIIRRKE